MLQAECAVDRPSYEPVSDAAGLPVAISLFADRTSTHEMRSNQLRLYFSSFAYVLMQTLRRLGLEGTSMAKAQCDTIRLKLFKIGAQIRISVRRVWIAFSDSYPHADLFRRILYKLQLIPLRC